MYSVPSTPLRCILRAMCSRILFCEHRNRYFNAGELDLGQSASLSVVRRRRSDGVPQGQHLCVGIRCTRYILPRGRCRCILYIAMCSRILFCEHRNRYFICHAGKFWDGVRERALRLRGRVGYPRVFRGALGLRYTYTLSLGTSYVYCELITWFTCIVMTASYCTLIYVRCAG